MKKIFTLVCVVMIALVWAVPVLADLSFSERGLGIFISLGQERDETLYQVVLTDAETGEILVTQGRTIYIDEGHRIHMQVLPNDPKEAKKFDFAWTTMALTSKDNMRMFSFDQNFGWLADINPIDYAQDLVNARCLSIKARAFGAKKDFLRAIFKITYNRSSVFQTEQFIIKTVRAEDRTNVSQPETDRLTAIESDIRFLKESCGVINENQNRTAVVVNENRNRIANLEDWSEKAVASQNGSSTGYPGANLPCVIRLTGNVSNVRLITYDSSKSTRVFAINSGDNLITLPAGQYQFVLSAGGKKSAVSQFSVRAGMSPVRINVN